MFVLTVTWKSDSLWGDSQKATIIKPNQGSLKEWTQETELKGTETLILNV